MYRSIVIFSVAVALVACARVAVPFGNGDTSGGGTGGNGGGSGVPGTGDAIDLATPWRPADMAAPVAPDDMATVAPTPPADLAMLRDLATAPPDLATPPSTCHHVINEIQTGTSATGTEEFVELFNPCSAAVTVTGWKLVYRAASNTNPQSGSDSSTLYTFAAGSFAAGSYRVFAGSGFHGTSDGALASGIAASGAVGLRDAGGALVDSVGYGSVAGNTFVETAAAPLPPTLASPGGSIERLPNGTDTDDNSHDFQTATTATPGAANH
jgi:hypothetical protein